MALEEELTARGWFLNEDFIKEVKEEIPNPRADDVITQALDLDLTTIGSGSLPTDTGRNKQKNKVSGPAVLQIQRVRNVCAPKASQESDTGNKLLRLYLSDGKITLSALQIGKWSSISMSTPPGTKLFLKPQNVPISNGFLLLSDRDFKVLGGTVQEMVEKWRVAKNLSQHKRQSGDDSNPPPFVEFGQHVDTSLLKRLRSGGGFKSMDQCNPEKKETEPNDAFEQHRKRNIIEAAKESTRKVFGTARDMQDGDIAQLMGHGYSAEIAVSALKANNNNLVAALEQLELGGGGSHNGDFRNGRGGGGGRGRGGDQDGGRGGGGRGRGRRGGREGGREDRRRGGEGDGVGGIRPSAPPTLFDILQTQVSLPVTSSTESTTSATNSAYSARNSNYPDRRANNNNSARGGRQSYGDFRGSGRRDNSRMGPQRSGYNSRSDYSGRDNNTTSTPRPSSYNDFPSLTPSTGPPPPNTSQQTTTPYVQQHQQQFNRSQQQQLNRSPQHQQLNRSSPSQQQQEQSQPTTVHQYRSGDKVLTKYWEDGNLYRSIVHQMSADGSTCVVQFPDYGNYEEVLTADIEAISLAQWEAWSVDSNSAGTNRRAQQTNNHYGALNGTDYRNDGGNYGNASGRGYQSRARDPNSGYRYNQGPSRGGGPQQRFNNDNRQNPRYQQQQQSGYPQQDGYGRGYRNNK